MKKTFPKYTEKISLLESIYINLMFCIFPVLGSVDCLTVKLTVIRVESSRKRMLD